MEPDITKMNPGQIEVHKLITEEWESDYFSPLSIMAQITEEVGEVAKVVNSTHGERKTKRSDEIDLESEIGDVLFALSCLANTNNINFDEALKKTINKRKGRDNNRFTEKS